jgi:hypothetical protein
VLPALGAVLAEIVLLDVPTERAGDALSAMALATMSDPAVAATAIFAVKVRIERGTNPLMGTLLSTLVPEYSG